MNGLLRLSVAAAILAAAPFVHALSLRGSVAHTNGAPIPDATVYIYTAKPRVGPGITCPSCYPDCGKRARTDAEGKFSIPSLSSDLIFQLVVMAKGYRPTYVTNADPIGALATAKLAPLKITDVPPENRIGGKILGPAGQGVAGATLDVEGVRYGPYSYSSALGGRVDPLAVTDERGEFLFNCSNDLAAITVTIDAPALAKRRLWLDSGKTHLIRLDDGVTVTGRLLRDGVPAAGASVAMTTQEREASVFMHGFEVATDAKGRFTLQNIPANNRYFLYTKMRDMRDFGLALPLQSINSGASGTEVKLGDLKTAPAYTVRGRIVLSDGEPLPPKTRMHLGRESAWDHDEMIVRDDGTFEFSGVPAESVSLAVRVKGYRISANNPSKDWLNEGLIVGRVQGDMDDFLIELEPGDRFPRDARSNGDDRQPRDKPLRGAARAAGEQK